jgi:Domain of unknown function (DUF5658)
MAHTEFDSAEPTDDGSPRSPAVTRRLGSRWHATSAGRLLLALFVALQFLDIVSTNRALAVPGVWEANPLMAASQTALGAAWWLPKLAAAGLIAVTVLRSRRRWPMFFVVSVSALAVLVNLAHLRG